jgi:DNA-binding NarL/FixJ family response regulator
METTRSEGANINVLVVDDHTTIRAGLRAILTEAGFRGELGEATDGHEAVALACGREWDVIVLDITLPGISGLDVLARVIQCRPEQRVVMLSMHSNPSYIRHAMKAGAAAYLTKETAPDELVSAIQAVLAGKTYLGDDLAALL